MASKVTKGQLVQALYRCLPNAHLIADLNLEADDAVTFAWGGSKFWVCCRGFVEEARKTDGYMRSTPMADLIEALLRRELRG